MPKICKHCGYERQEIESVSEDECPRCGAIYIKVEAQLKRKAEELLHQKEQVEQVVIAQYNEQEEGNQNKDTAFFKTKNIQLDCSACKSKASMKATEIPRFNTILRVIGFIIVIPSILGIIIAFLLFFSSISATFKVMSLTQSDTVTAGTAIGTSIGVGFSIFIGCSSLVGGIIGWLMLMKKKVYKCINCGFILDRG